MGEVNATSTVSKPAKFLVVNCKDAAAKGEPLSYTVEGQGADLRLAKKSAATEAPRFAKQGDKVLVYELRWVSKARVGDIVLEEEAEPEAEPKGDGNAPAEPPAPVPVDGVPSSELIAAAMAQRGAA